MSFHYPSVLHRQFSSPTSPRFPQELPSAEDITQDSKDILIERLNDLTQRLSDNTSVDENTITAIHKEVDQIETVLRGARFKTSAPSTTSPAASVTAHNEMSSRAATPTPTQKTRLQRPTPSRQTIQASTLTPTPISTPAMSPARATELANAADDLVGQLTDVITELQARREEACHIHDLLVERCERAAARIVTLEEHITHTDGDFEACQSELKYLRIQLRALDVQCRQYVPPDVDAELSECIRNWRVDWEVVDRRTKARRRRARERVGDDVDDGREVVDGSWITVDG